MFEPLNERLGHVFHDPALLQKALTHRSFYFENRATSPGHSERLEFLGDAVLDLVLSEALMKAFPQAEEGTLSKWRASLVNESMLAEIARDLDLANFIFLGRSEESQRGQMRPRLLASTLEAILGALYLDGGLAAARMIIEREFASRVEKLDMNDEFAADYKTKLQEWSQKQFHSVPDYKLIHAEGPEHAKIFTYEVYINGKSLGLGTGQSRKGAEQAAAQDALSKENVQ